MRARVCVLWDTYDLYGNNGQYGKSVFSIGWHGKSRVTGQRIALD